jgi:hypothetical protein
MSGSRREFAYEFDDGNVCALLLDESNTEQANGASAALSTLGLIILPIARKCRRGRYVSNDKLHALSVVFLTPADSQNRPASIIVNKANGSGGTLTVELFFKKAYAESFAVGSGRDSALNDGDDP